jgi:ribosome-binding protein aMBF1 (putative translation factor)
MVKKQANPARHTVSGQLRDVIESRGQDGLTHTELGKRSNVDPTVIARFVAGEREIRNRTFDKLAAALGLRLVEVEKRSKGWGRSSSRTTEG